MKNTLRLITRGATVGVVGIFGVLTIIASGGSVSGPTGPDDPETTGPETTCGGNPVSDSSTWFEIYRNDSASRCFLNRRFILADSKEEAIQCEEDLGFHGEYWQDARPCDYYFRENTGQFCSVHEIFATSADNAEQCLEFQFGGGSNTNFTNITSQVKPDDTSQFCSNTRDGSAISAACPD